MKYRMTSPLERFFTEEKETEIKNKLLLSHDKLDYKRFFQLSKVCLERDDFSDDFAERLVNFYCWLIDNDFKDELCDLLKLYPFWGCYNPGIEELSPLCYAIYKSKTDIVETMIKIQAPDHLDSFEGYQPGFVAIDAQQYDIIRILLKNGVKEDYFAGAYTGLQLAAYNMDLTAAKIFLDEFHHDVNKVQISKTPPLNIAVENDDIMMVKFFLEKPETDVNIPDENGFNAVEIAKSDEVRELLISKGAIPSSENTKLICRAIQEATESKTEELNNTVKKLIDMPEKKAVNGVFDLLYYTVKYDQYKATEMIMENNLLDLSDYHQNLFFLCACVFRKDRHERTDDEIMRYLRLFDKYGYRFCFPEKSYEHSMACHVIEKLKSNKAEALDIMKRAGVIIKEDDIN